MSVSLPISTVHSNSDLDDAQCSPSVYGIPIFDSPGKLLFRLKSAYGEVGELCSLRAVYFNIRVVSPDRFSDIEVAKLLSKDRRMVSELCDTYSWPSDYVCNKLTDIVSQYPNSVYSDLIRWAIARHALKGYGSSLREPNFCDALVAIGFPDAPLPKDIVATSRIKVEEFRRSWFQYRHLSEKERLAVERYVQSAYTSRDEWEAAVREMRKFFTVTEQDRQKATLWLDRIRDSKFVFMPHVKICRLILAEDISGTKNERLRAEIERDYHDSLEWLEYIANEIYRFPLSEALDDWRRYRVRKTKL